MLAADLPVLLPRFTLLQNPDDLLLAKSLPLHREFPLSIYGNPHFRGGTIFGGYVTYSLSWNTATVTNGAHTLTARATDAAGNQTSSSPITVNVNNYHASGCNHVTQ